MRRAYVRWNSCDTLVAGGESIDVVISHVEINFAHGTGVILSRLFEGRSDFVAIRSRTYYGGRQRISAREALVLPFGMTNRRKIFDRVSKWLRKYRVRSILCVPYCESDVTVAIAAQAVTGAPLGIWIMDDNCLVRNDGVPRELMAEAIDRATALFAISPELKRRYQSEFRKALTVVPPLVAASMVRTSASPIPTKRRLLVIGNVWSVGMLDRMSRVVEAAGLSVEWLSSNPRAAFGPLTPACLAERGIVISDGSDPDAVRQAVIRASAVIVPSDPGDAGAYETSLGATSLPSRMPFVLATAGTPMIVLARPATVAGAFVERLGVGRVVPYDGAALRAAVEDVERPEVQMKIRSRSAELAEKFSFAGVSDFIFDTILAGGRWSSDRFEALLPDRPIANEPFVNKPVSAQYASDYGDLVSLCDRLKGVGFTPNFVLGVGTIAEKWFSAVSSVFDTARCVAWDPSRGPKINIESLAKRMEPHTASNTGVASNPNHPWETGRARQSVNGTSGKELIVPLDLTKQVNVEGPCTGLLRVDATFIEHVDVGGMLEPLLKRIDVVIVNLALAPNDHEPTSPLDICARMDKQGFRMFDQIGGQRHPSTGELLRVDIVFARKQLNGIAPVPRERGTTERAPEISPSRLHA
jgi:hypothetical protein